MTFVRGSRPLSCSRCRRRDRCAACRTGRDWAEPSGSQSPTPTVTPTPARPSISGSMWPQNFGRRCEPPEERADAGTPTTWQVDPSVQRFVPPGWISCAPRGAGVGGVLPVSSGWTRSGFDVNALVFRCRPAGRQRPLPGIPRAAVRADGRRLYVTACTPWVSRRAAVLRDLGRDAWESAPGEKAVEADAESPRSCSRSSEPGWMVREPRYVPPRGGVRGSPRGPLRTPDGGSAYERSSSSVCKAPCGPPAGSSQVRLSAEDGTVVEQPSSWSARTTGARARVRACVRDDDATVENGQPLSCRTLDGEVTFAARLALAGRDDDGS